MNERDARLDKLFESYYKPKRPKGRVLSDHNEMDRPCSARLIRPDMSVACFSRMPMEDACPDLALLGAYVEGALSKEEAGRIAEHVKHCKTCREQVNSASATIRDMQENRLEKTPDKLSSDTSKKLKKSL